MSSQRPAKKRRTKKGVRIIGEGDDITADGVITRNVGYHTESGPVTEVSSRHVWLNEENASPVPIEPVPDPEPANFLDDGGAGYEDTGAVDPHIAQKTRSQQEYLRAFVECVDAMLGALLSRETPTSLMCSHCAEKVTGPGFARWRCRDCTSSSFLCRQCMRETHKDSPLHRIERWNGQYFEPASLWQVGVYILIPHHSGTRLCATLEFNERLLHGFQQTHDAREQAELRQSNGQPAAGTHPRRPMDPTLPQEDDLINSEVEGDCADDNPGDAQFAAHLDRLYNRDEAGGQEGHEDDLLEEDEAEPNDEYIIEMPPNYMPASVDNGTADPHEPNMERPQTDALDNPFLRIVHTNGIHHISTVFCNCRGRENTHSDVMAAGLVPTSFIRYRTMFTHAVLDDFRVSNLECKTSAYHYFQKLRRHTSPTSPESVPNLYHELRRMSRLWRWMKKLKWGGIGHSHDDHRNLEAGRLANFCPACPQPGINLPEDWHLDEKRWVYQRSFVADGNFKADHVRQKNPDNDVWLSEGAGMIPKRAEYEEFLRAAVNRHTKAPCENRFRAIEMGMLLSKACDVTGIVAWACARHGCFAPNTVANMSAGEQQRDVDFGLLKLLITTHVDSRQGLKAIYDIVCQYIVYLLERIGHLLPPDLIIDAAIGLFHVHGHKDTCFFRYATSFIPGSGVVAGEILESLWSVLNAVTPAMRTATLAHRAEIMDDHMTESNHKKLLGMVTALCNRYIQSSAMSRSAKEYYANLIEGIPPEDVQEWQAQMEHAEKHRMEDRSVMDIIGAGHVPQSADPAPAQDDPVLGIVSQWIQLAIAIEEQQILLQDRVRRLAKEPREEDRKEVEQLREKLMPQFELLDQMCLRATEGRFGQEPELMGEDPAAFDDMDEDDTAGNIGHRSHDNDGHGPATRAQAQVAATINAGEFAIGPPETRRLSIPSTWSSTENEYRVVELELRIQQATKTLQALRDSIADKSFQFSHVIRVAPKKGVRTRARATIAKLNHLIAYQSRVYGRCRAAMARLGADNPTLNKFQILLKEHVKSSTALLNPNEPGSTRLQLTWIWKMSSPGAAGTPAALREFNRVHWIRARSQKHRWQEEFIITGYEMQWTVRYYLHQAKVWSDRGIVSEYHGDAGATAYAHRKIAMWTGMAKAADIRFKQVNRAYEGLTTV